MALKTLEIKNNIKNIHGIKIEKLDSHDELILSKKINKLPRIENLKNDKKLFAKNFKENKNKRIAIAKLKLSEIMIAIPATKKAFKANVKEFKLKHNTSIKNIETQRAGALAETHIIETNSKFERIAEYLNHKYGNDSSKLEKELDQNRIEWDKELAITFDVDDSKIDEKIAIEKIKFEKELILLQEKYDSEMTTLIANKLDLKSKFSVKKKEILKAVAAETLKKKVEFNSRKVKIEEEFKVAKKEVKEKGLYFNAFGEAVSEKSFTDIVDVDKVLPTTKDIDVPNPKQQRLMTKINKLRDSISGIEEKYTGSFDQKVKLIEMRIKLRYFSRMIETYSSFDKEVIKLEEKLAKIDTQENKIQIKSKQNSGLVEVKNIFNARKKEIKSGYANGNFSKLSYINSLAEAKRNYKDTKREVFFNNEISSLKGQIKYKSYEVKNEIAKEVKIMYSEIDDSQRNIPTKFDKNAIKYSTISSLLLPGLGQLLNKQYAKGVMMLLMSMFIYGVLIPVTFGVISFRGDGVFGLGILSPVIGESSSGGFIYLDARYRIVEGVLSVIALSVGVILIILSSRDAYKVAKTSWFGGRPKNARDLRRFLTNKGLPMVLSTPAIFMILMVVILPLATTFLLAFTDYSYLTQPPGNGLSWVGWSNFKRIFIGNYGKSFAFVSMWTMMWTVGTTVGVLVIGTLLALAVDNERVKGKTMWFMIYILPWAVPAFATILFFAAAFSNGGLMNQLLGVGTNFKQSTNWTRIILITIQVWLGNAYIFMLMSGVKKSISDDYYEAASIDGASKNRQFWSITAPIILFQIMPLLIGQIVFNFNNYGIIWMFNDGGPATSDSLVGNPGSTDIIISFIFKLTTNTQNSIALASAFTIVVSIGVVSLAAIGFFRSKSFREDKL